MNHIVVDLEMNHIRRNSEARKICSMETIEIGAVMLDDDLQEITTFRTYVKPEHSDGITRKITRLTGITDNMVFNAPKFSSALRMFTDWSLGNGDDITVYAWSRTDYGQISKEMCLKEYEPSEKEAPVLRKEWSDFQHEFENHLGFNQNISLKAALDMAGIDFTGSEHDALDDARNTAELLKVFHNKELFSKTLQKIKEILTPKKSMSTMGDLIDFSKFACA